MAPTFPVCMFKLMFRIEIVFVYLLCFSHLFYYFFIWFVTVLRKNKTGVFLCVDCAAY